VLRYVIIFKIVYLKSLRVCIVSVVVSSNHRSKFLLQNTTVTSRFAANAMPVYLPVPPTAGRGLVVTRHNSDRQYSLVLSVLTLTLTTVTVRRSWNSGCAFWSDVLWILLSHPICMRMP
jgi:hypothetical protein